MGRSAGGRVGFLRGKQKDKEREGAMPGLVFIGMILLFMTSIVVATRERGASRGSEAAAQTLRARQTRP